MTNREWINGLSDEEFVEKLGKIIEPCERFFIPTCLADDCGECMETWLKQKHKPGHYITNIKGKRVRVPYDGEFLWIVSMGLGGVGEEIEIAPTSWKNNRSFLLLLYQNRIFTDYSEAVEYYSQCQENIDKAIEEAGLKLVPSNENKKEEK